jgi:hypothetical protein
MQIWYSDMESHLADYRKKAIRRLLIKMSPFHAEGDKIGKSLSISF